MRLKVSPGNIKMGSIPSVSLPAGLTCRPGCTCIDKCYARKIERLRPTVRNAYLSNYNLLQEDEDTYWEEVEKSVKTSRFFRFHVSGDIPDVMYLYRMIDVANNNPECQMLCFTKQYEMVNEVAERTYIPPNLHLIMSAWRGIEMKNPFRFPEAHVIYRDGFTTASDNAIPCGGNCTECATTDGGCWALKNGQEVVFHEH